MSVVQRVQHPWAGRLGRLYTPDERDAGFPLRAITAAAAVERATPWGLGPTLDQGQTPRCVAFTGREWLSAESQGDPDQAHPTTAQLYAGAQANDGIPLPHDGSNDRGLCQYMQAQGLIGNFHWAQNVDEAIAYLLTTGTLMCGSNWTQGMFYPDANGFIRPLGPVEGGHEFHGYWFSRAEDAFWFQQSWGNWNPAFPGRFKIKRDDIATLFAQGLDFCAATYRKPPPPAPPKPPAPNPWPAPSPRRRPWWMFLHI